MPRKDFPELLPDLIQSPVKSIGKRSSPISTRKCGRLDDVRSFIDTLYGPELHAKRVDSLARATFGVMTAASLYTIEPSLLAKHAD
jgi:hypothetical protein